MLGFSGYAELKACLQKTILEQINPAALLARAVSSNDSFPDSIFKAEHANLDDTMAQLVPADIDKFCEMVKGANNNLLHRLGHLVARNGADADTPHRHGMPRVPLPPRRPLALGAGARRPRGRHRDSLRAAELRVEVTESVEIAHRNGAKVITMTDSAAAPVCRFAELQINVSANSPTFGSSIIGPIFLTHVLTSSLAVSLGDEAKKSFDEQAQFLHDERIFHPIFGLKY